MNMKRLIGVDRREEEAKARLFEALDFFEKCKAWDVIVRPPPLWFFFFLYPQSLLKSDQLEYLPLLVSVGSLIREWTRRLLSVCTSPPVTRKSGSKCRTLGGMSLSAEASMPSLVDDEKRRASMLASIDHLGALFGVGDRKGI